MRSTVRTSGSLRLSLASSREFRSRTPFGSSILYGTKDSPKYERAAMRWLERYITESSPSLRNFAKVAVALAERESWSDGS